MIGAANTIRAARQDAAKIVISVAGIKRSGDTATLVSL